MAPGLEMRERMQRQQQQDGGQWKGFCGLPVKDTGLFSLSYSLPFFLFLFISLSLSLSVFVSPSFSFTQQLSMRVCLSLASFFP